MKKMEASGNIVFGLDPESINRYSRQVVVPGVGVDGQSKIQAAKVAVVGAGGLGSPVLQYLVMAGVGTVGVLDYDTVEIHNLQRQSVHRERWIGRPKTQSAMNLLREMNSTVQIKEHRIKIEKETVERELEKYEVILDCTDSIKTRYLLNDYCKRKRKAFICGAVLGWEGQVCVVPPGGRCFRCMFRGEKKEAASCDQNGVVGPMCGAIGSIQAVEAVKEIIEGGRNSRLIVMDGFNNSYRSFEMKGGCEKQCREVEAISCKEVEEDAGLTLEEVVGGNYKVIDIRSRQHFEMVHLRGSEWVGEPMECLEKLRRDGRTVAVMCYRGRTAGRVARKLRELGVEAFRIAGGMQGVIKAHQNGGGTEREGTDLG